MALGVKPPLDRTMIAWFLWNTGAKSDSDLLCPSTDVLQDAKPCLPPAWNRWVVCPAGVLILEAHCSTFYHKPVLWIRICQYLSSILKITESLISIYSCAQSIMKTACEINGTVQSFLPLCVQCAIKLRARLVKLSYLTIQNFGRRTWTWIQSILISVLHSLDFQGSTTSRSGSGQCSLINFTWEFLSHQ